MVFTIPIGIQSYSQLMIGMSKFSEGEPGSLGNIGKIGIHFLQETWHLYFFVGPSKFSHEIKHQQSGRNPTSYKYREDKNPRLIAVIPPATHMGVSLNGGTNFTPQNDHF